MTGLMSVAKARLAPDVRGVTRTGIRRFLLGLAAIVAACGTSVAPIASAANPILDALNAQRTANGIPPVIWNPDWAAKVKAGALEDLHPFDRSLLTSLL